MDDIDQPPARFHLELSTGPTAPATARLFVAAVMRRWGLDESLIDDCKLAVSEAVTLGSSGEESRAINVALSDDPYRLIVWSLERNASPETSLHWSVIEALFPDTSMDGDRLQVIIPDG